MKKFQLWLAMLFLVTGSFLIFEPLPAARAIIVCDGITLDQPNGGETWVSGATQNITWTITDNSNPYTGIDIFYSTDSGGTFPNSIVGNTANDGQYEWLVPTGINSSNVQIQLVGRQAPNNGCDQDSFNGTDQSDGDFTISDPATNISDTMTDSTISSSSGHKIEYGIISTIPITDGSIKITWPAGFNLTGVTASDLTISGGDVLWGVPAINAGSRTAVFPFTGILDSADGKITINFIGPNYITNPATAGEYRLEFTSHTTSNGTGTPVEDRTFSVAITEAVVVTATVPNSLTFTVIGVAGGQSVNGETTTTASTSTTVSFGTFTTAGSAISAQDLQVSSNATNGFTVTTQANQTLTSSAFDTISHFTGTNASPSSWTTPPGGGTEGYWGYTTEDFTLGTGIASRFNANLWAGHSTIPYEVFYHDGPTDGTGAGQGITRVGYQMEITNNQPSGIYNASITYICTPTY